MPKKRSAARKASKKSFLKNSIATKFIGLVFLAIALFLLISPLKLPSNETLEKNPISVNPKLLSLKAEENLPKRILLPKEDIDLSITAAKVVNGYWELSETTASYGLGSGTPGTKSNTVIFAHARVGLFYNLKDVKLNDTIYVLTNNKWYSYKVTKITSVFPNQIEVIQPTKNETLTLFTCTGFSDEKRLIVQAVPQK